MNGKRDADAAVDGLADPALARLYREAAREEPPQQLDQAVCAAARRAADARPQNVAAPAKRSWRVPLSVAAVVVLSVTVVTLTVERRGEDLPKPVREAMQGSGGHAASEAVGGVPAAPVPDEEGRAQQKAGVPEPSSRARPPDRAGAPEEDAMGAPQVPPRDESRSPLAARDSPTRSESAAMSSPLPALTNELEGEPPGKWGERIVELRRRGRSVEADELLAEFQRRFPDYPVPTEWLR